MQPLIVSDIPVDALSGTEGVTSCQSGTLVRLPEGQKDNDDEKTRECDAVSIVLIEVG